MMDGPPGGWLEVVKNKKRDELTWVKRCE